MTAYGPGNPPPERDDPRGPVLLPLNGRHDHPYGGVANQHPPEEPWQKVRRCPHCSVEDGTPHYWDCASRQPKGSIRSQEEFLTALDELLDHTLHADECYIDAAQTECVCVIGKVRAAMPPCGAVRPRPFEDQRLTQPRKYWTCHRNAHPASPDRHTFG